MGKIITIIMAMLLCGCSSVKHYGVFQYDNGNDPIRDGMYRIVDKRGCIRHADGNGKTVIKPRFAFGFPFEEGKAKVTNKGEMKEVPGSGGEYHSWESDESIRHWGAVRMKPHCSMLLACWLIFT
ncbi:WG repeat-containing protein [Bacteroides helcogenes]|nr:WG repeat-containing protein [Bacteroides helcogenes]MDY5238918.1 WG repeat-containing protein [Bacteroides helcogenes]